MYVYYTWQRRIWMESHITIQDFQFLYLTPFTFKKHFALYFILLCQKCINLYKRYFDLSFSIKTKNKTKQRKSLNGKYQSKEIYHNKITLHAWARSKYGFNYQITFLSVFARKHPFLQWKWQLHRAWYDKRSKENVT